MLKVLTVTFLAFMATAAGAQESAEALQDIQPPIVRPGNSANLNEFVWKNRPLVVLADTPADPRFLQQMAYIAEQVEELAERDVVVLTDTDPAANGALRKKLRPRGFMLVLIGKDGTIYLRKPFPWNVREITRVIDKLPLRQQEIREGLDNS